MKNNILVIKHGALGDIILAGSAMQAIRNYHKNDNIICLTTITFEGLLKCSPWFDMIFIDSKPKWQDFKDWSILKNFFNKYKFKNVYDLQTSYRSNLYFFFFFANKKSNWSGIAIGSKYRHNNKNRKIMHTYDRQKDQLKLTGIQYDELPDWKWLASNYDNKSILPKDKFIIIVTGSAKHRKNKRWSEEKYAHLIEYLSSIGIKSILIGGIEESKNINDIIYKVSKEVKFTPLNYAGKTSFQDIVFISRYAICAIGNDTGPMHLLASSGLNSIVLFGAASNPDLCAPLGRNVHIIHKDSISDIKVEEISKILKTIGID
jgi:ADP-heptose:LPS heptosyltransferase